MEHQQQTYWQVQTLLSVPCPNKLQCFITCGKWGTKDGDGKSRTLVNKEVLENCQEIKCLMKQKKTPNLDTLKNQLKKVWCQEVRWIISEF